MELCSPDPTGTRYMALVYAMSITNLRMISLGTDVLDEFQHSGNLASLYKVLCYALYFPTFLTGPFLTYNDFIENVSSSVLYTKYIHQCVTSSEL